MMPVIFLPAVASFTITLSILFLLLNLRNAIGVLDHPNERSLHAMPVPRTGGLAIMAGILMTWGIAWQPWLLSLTLCVLFLVTLSFLDDVKSLSAKGRFLAHFLAAAIFLVIGSPLNVGVGLWLLALFAIVWMTNLFNFMDGSDGLAGGMALFGFGFYALAAWFTADNGLAGASLVIAASAAAFLAFNFHPARIFMGDAGSIPLGFLAAAIGLLGWQHGDWPLWFPVLVFSPFVVDATMTLCKRLLRGEKVWQAHRSHYYQRLVQMGWGHRKTALWEYVMMACSGATALWMMDRSWSSQVAGLGLWALMYWALAFTIDRRWAERC